jgi:hypothetical protein
LGSSIRSALALFDKEYDGRWILFP